MTPEIIITLLVQLFREGYKIKQIVESDKPETEEEYITRLRKLLDVPTLEELEGK